jgi:L-ascorbate metabolism protein UlaG (beta-lactamase superfamily)
VVTATLRVVEFSGSLAEQLAQPSAAIGEVVLYWLGQAGFVLDWDGRRALIDPYLSDSLARKYRGTRYGHVRTMASPIAPEAFTRVDLVLCTHRHTDHMDPDTLQPLGRLFPQLRFVVPAASATEAGKRCGVAANRLIAVNPGDDIEPLPGLRIRPLASAHETLDVDDAGRYEWLGYVVDIAGTRLYHSGDCVPYPGLVDAVRQLAPALALLPVNGRDTERSSNGVPGNFTLDEAVALCRNAGVPAMVAHHYGLFEFNTVPASVIDSRVAPEALRGLSLVRARLGEAIHVAANDAR